MIINLHIDNTNNSTTQLTDSDVIAGNYLFLWGVACTLCSGIGASTGLLLQKVAAQEQVTRIQKGLPPHKMAGDIVLSPTWLLGFCLLTFVPIPFDFFAFQFASQSLIVPLGSMSIVYTMLNAPFITKEKVTRLDFVAAFIIVGGCVITTLTGSHSTVYHTLSSLLTLYAEPNFLILEGAIFTVAIICYTTTRIRHLPGSIVGRLLPVFFAYICASFGSLQNVVFKSLSELSADSTSWLNYPIYIFAVCAIGLAVTQLSFINKGLALFPGIVFLPIYNTCQIILSTSVGSVFYKEYKNQTATDLGIFILGCFIASCGVIIIAVKGSLNSTTHVPASSTITAVIMRNDHIDSTGQVATSRAMNINMNTGSNSNIHHSKQKIELVSVACAEDTLQSNRSSFTLNSNPHVIVGSPAASDITSS